MQLPQDTDSLFDQFVQALPDDFEQLAYDTGAFTRSRKLQSPTQLMQLVMLYCGMDYSLRGCAAELAQHQGYISDTAVKKRLTGCAEWLRCVVNGILGVKEETPDTGLLRFLLIDGSTVQVPGATETSYRLHIAMDLLNQRVQQVTITDEHQGESLDHYVLDAGDVLVIDRGYNRPCTLVPFIAKGGSIVLRYNPHSMNLFEPTEGEHWDKIDWEKAVKAAEGKPFCRPVALRHHDKQGSGKREFVQGYVHAIPLPKEKADQARRRTRERAKKRGGEPSQKALRLSGWMFIFTSLPPTVVDTATLSSFYRVRWQVELLIKRLKSLLNIDHLRATKGSALAEVYLYGKLLYAVVTEKLTSKQFGAQPLQFDALRQLTPWRMLHTVSDSIKLGFKQCFRPQQRYIDDSIRALSERPRKRKLQSLPQRWLEILQGCRLRGLARV